MLLHAAHITKQGYGNIFIKTVDTDVVVLCVTFLGKLGCKSLLVASGTGKSFRYIDVTSVAEALGEEKCQALSSFHALTGSDHPSKEKANVQRWLLGVYLTN